MTTITRTTVGLFISALLLVPAASPARADRDDRWEDWREAQEERREEMEDRWEDDREAREEWREEQRERWEDYQEELEDRAEEHSRFRHGWHDGPPGPYYNGRVYAPCPPYGHHEYWGPGPVYRHYYRPYYGRYYGTRRFGFFDHGRGGTVHAGPVWVRWD